MEYVKLEEICTIVSGGTPSRSKPNYWNNGNIPWIKIKDMKSKYIDSAEEFITEEGLNNSSTKMLKRGTILYSIFATLGEVGILKIDACTNQAIAGLSLKEDSNILKEYLYYYLKSKKKDVNNLGRGVAQNNINLSLLRKFKIPVIPLCQQKKIIEVLDNVSSTINNYERELALLDELVKARFVEMFGEYEASVKLSRYIKELRAGKSLAGKTKCKNKVLKTGAATFGFFDKEQYKYYPVEYVPNPLHKVEDGDVIISRMNTPELVGSCSYVFEAPDDMYYPDRLWKTIITEDTNPIFLWQLMWQQDIRKQIKENSFGTSGTMNNISKVKLLNIKAIDVPLELQNQFASFVQEIDKSRLLSNHSLFLIKSIIF